jgi:hypothetical protein
MSTLACTININSRALIGQAWQFKVKCEVPPCRPAGRLLKYEAQQKRSSESPGPEGLGVPTALSCLRIRSLQADLLLLCANGTDFLGGKGRSTIRRDTEKCMT